MSCEIISAAANIPPNGCEVRNREWPLGCLTEFAGGRQTIAAAASYQYKFALDRSGMVPIDIVADMADAASASELYITAIDVDSNPVFPKTVSATTNNNAVQEVPLSACSREAVYWYGGGPLGTGTPFSAILRALGALARDKGVFITVTNKGAGPQVVPNLSLVMGLDRSMAQADA